MMVLFMRSNVDGLFNLNAEKYLIEFSNSCRLKIGELKSQSMNLSCFYNIFNIGFILLLFVGDLKIE